MAYSGANVTAESRKALGDVLEALQQDPDIPRDVLSIAENVAKAIGSLFEAEKAGSDSEGKASVRNAMSSLSQTLALLQDVSSEHKGVEVAARSLAGIMSKLYPLTALPTIRPSVPPAGAEEAGTAVPKAARVPAEAVPEPVVGPRQQLEANVGANTESNFFVGFSGEVSEGGVFVATYSSLPLGTPVEILVTLPGGYETTVLGRVFFVRDPMDMDSEPGIGVRFEGLSQQSRELILRFIRKRPPLFFDY
jgi:uncharacterized protein (TIGR02266 family)